ncbi:B-cell receptor CD22-like [Synchiropus picturatus]
MISQSHFLYQLSVKCSAEYPVKDSPKRAENLLLNVTYSPKTYVSIHPSAPVPAASSVNLSCLSRANPPASQFTWYQRSSDGDTVVSQGQNYTVFNVTHTVVLFCVARNALGEGTSEEIQLWVSEQIHWMISGAIIGFVMLVCLFVCVWRLQSRVQTPQWIQSSPQVGQKIQISQGSASAFHEEGKVHYGEIDFSKRNMGRTAAAVDHRRQQQDTVYAEVRVSDSSPGATQAVADIPGDLYAQVNKS